MTFMFPTGEPPFESAWCSRLVDAVVAAHDGDESLHVEWKSSLDLTSKAGRSAVAKAIIAFANRDPQEAQRAASGYGVLVVGADPGRVAGIEQADPADWEPELRRLLGADGPQYEVHWVPRNDRWVLVVLVSPPRPGDPIHYPRRTSGAVISGHPVIRRPGQSEHPDADEMDRLQARARDLRPGMGIDVSVSGYAVACDFTGLLSDADTFLESLGDRMRAAPTPARLFGVEQINESFDVELQEWLGRARRWFPCAFRSHLGVSTDPVVITLREDGGRFHAGVQLDVSQRSGVVSDWVDWAGDPPPLPEKSLLSGFSAADLWSTWADFEVGPSTTPPFTSVLEPAGSEIVFGAGDLRPTSSLSSAPLLLVVEEGTASAVELTYSLTVHGADGVRPGEVSVEVEEVSVSVDEIIERWAPDWLTVGLT